MSITAKSNFMKVLARSALAALFAFSLLPLCSCASKSGDEGVVEHVLKYADRRAFLDMAVSCVVANTPDAKVEISLLNFEETPSGEKEIQIVPTVISDTMASWTQDEWAKNQDDLFFNLVAHFNVICKQAHEFGDVPENYSVTSPDYMVVYDSTKSNGFVVTSSGVYHKTDNPENPIGEAVVLIS